MDYTNNCKSVRFLFHGSFPLHMPIKKMRCFSYVLITNSYAMPRAENLALRRLAPTQVSCLISV
jgi:hypothetical protein